MTSFATLSPPPADRLIADFGQPNFPFWRLIILLALATQLVVVAQIAMGADIDQIRTTRGGPRTPSRPGRKQEDIP